MAGLFIGVAGMFYSGSMVAHAMVCIAAKSAPNPEPNELKCAYHYAYTTNDRWRCYIKFGLGNGIRLMPQSALSAGDLGTVALKSNIFGIEDKSHEATKSDAQSGISSAATLQRQGFKDFTTFTASSQGTPLAIRFDGFMALPDVKKLYNRDNIASNMTLDQLRALVGPGTTVLHLPDLINKMKQMKIPGCTVAFPQNK